MLHRGRLWAVRLDGPPPPDTDADVEQDEKSHRDRRLQLIEGPELKYLIKEHLGKDVIPGPVPPKRRPTR